VALTLVLSREHSGAETWMWGIYAGWGEDEALAVRGDEDDGVPREQAKRDGLKALFRGALCARRYGSFGGRMSRGSKPIVVPLPLLREVLSTAASGQDAAKVLGIDDGTLRKLATRNQLGGLLAECKRRGWRNRGKRGPGQYNFVDMTGKTLAGVSVLSRAPDVTGNAVWRCEHPCGHVCNHQGIFLRAQQKKGLAMRCKVCEPPRGGRARRVTLTERGCDECHLTKPIADFDGDATTCRQCETELATPRSSRRSAERAEVSF
jgi:hypothetical protein